VGDWKAKWGRKTETGGPRDEEGERGRVRNTERSLTYYLDLHDASPSAPDPRNVIAQSMKVERPRARPARGGLGSEGR
jgi:hypothetical protein